MSDEHSVSTADLEAMRRQWLEAWPRALEAWSKYTRLRPPTLCLTIKDAQSYGLTDSFAMIRLQDQAVVVNLSEAAAFQLQPYAVEVLAHEIGHHVLAPATLTDHARMIARMRRGLPTVEQQAPMVANLYSDLLINDRLQRSANLRLADIYRKLAKKGEGGGAVWSLYMRIYEILWKLDRGSLGGGKTDDRLEGDAWLGARLIRTYSHDWLNGSGRFASLLLPHLLEDQQSAEIIERWFDTKNAATGGEPSGLVAEEENERDGAIHPAEDPDLTDDAEIQESKPTEVAQNQQPRGQAREPFEYGEILRAAGVKLSDHDITVRYYRERALPYLIPFPSITAPESTEPLMEGLEPWDIGHPLDEADWLQSVLQSPRVIPGMTTVQRVWGTTEGTLPERIPLDLDLYVDSSGSMPNPQQLTSYPALAGAIVCLSALRAGARVHATLWSGKHQVTQTDGFLRDEDAILRVLTGYFGGGTAFPIHVLRKTYQDRPAGARPTHLLMISDDGITTMFDQDEKGNSGWDVAATALARAGGGGSLVLNLVGDNAVIQRAQDQQGWRLYRITKWEDLVEFSREFSHLRYAEKH